MASRMLRPEEEHVRGRLQQVLGVAVTPHDDGSKPSMPDLLIEYTDRPPAPVEVTSDVDESTVRALNTLDKRFNGGVWPAPRSRRAWLLHTVAAPSLRDLRAQAEGHLLTLEALGIETFDAHNRMTHRLRRWDAAPQTEPLIALGARRTPWPRTHSQR